MRQALKYTRDYYYVDPSDAIIDPSSAIKDPSGAIIDPSDAIIDPSDTNAYPSDIYHKIDPWTHVASLLYCNMRMLCILYLGDNNLIRRDRLAQPQRHLHAPPCLPPPFREDGR